MHYTPFLWFNHKNYSPEHFEFFPIKVGEGKDIKVSEITSYTSKGCLNSQKYQTMHLHQSLLYFIWFNFLGQTYVQYLSSVISIYRNKILYKLITFKIKIISVVLLLQSRWGWFTINYYRKDPPFLSLEVPPPQCTPARSAMPAARGKTSLNARDWWKGKELFI